MAPQSFKDLSAPYSGAVTFHCLELIFTFFGGLCTIYTFKRWKECYFEVNTVIKSYIWFSFADAIMGVTYFIDAAYRLSSLPAPIPNDGWCKFSAFTGNSVCMAIAVSHCVAAAATVRILQGRPTSTRQVHLGNCVGWVIAFIDSGIYLGGGKFGPYRNLYCLLPLESFRSLGTAVAMPVLLLTNMFMIGTYYRAARLADEWEKADMIRLNKVSDCSSANDSPPIQEGSDKVAGGDSIAGSGFCGRESTKTERAGMLPNNRGGGGSDARGTGGGGAAAARTEARKNQVMSLRVRASRILVLKGIMVIIIYWFGWGLVFFTAAFLAAGQFVPYHLDVIAALLIKSMPTLDAIFFEVTLAPLRERAEARRAERRKVHPVTIAPAEGPEGGDDGIPPLQPLQYHPTHMTVTDMNSDDLDECHPLSSVMESEMGWGVPCSTAPCAEENIQSGRGSTYYSTTFMDSWGRPMLMGMAGVRRGSNDRQSQQNSFASRGGPGGSNTMMMNMMMNTIRMPAASHMMMGAEEEGEWGLQQQQQGEGEGQQVGLGGSLKLKSGSCSPPHSGPRKDSGSGPPSPFHSAGRKSSNSPMGSARKRESGAAALVLPVDVENPLV